MAFSYKDTIRLPDIQDDLYQQRNRDAEGTVLQKAVKWLVIGVVAAVLPAAAAVDIEYIVSFSAVVFVVGLAWETINLQRKRRELKPKDRCRHKQLSQCYCTSCGAYMHKWARIEEDIRGNFGSDFDGVNRWDTWEAVTVYQCAGGCGGQGKTVKDERVAQPRIAYRNP